MIKTIIFDFDDTLYTNAIWDQSWTEYLKAGFRKLTNDEQRIEEIFKKHNIGVRTNTKTIMYILEEEGLSTRKMRRYIIRNIFNLNGDNIKAIFDAVLYELSKKQSLYIVTLSEQPHVKFYCKKFNINADLFKGMYTLNLVSKKRTKGKIYKKIMKKEKVSADEILVVGDNLNNDILPAQELGMKTFHFNGDYNQMYAFLKNEGLLSFEVKAI